eukprot:6152670-Amphidinium_carterae.1
MQLTNASGRQSKQGNGVMALSPDVIGPNVGAPTGFFSTVSPWNGIHVATTSVTWVSGVVGIQA